MKPTITRLLVCLSTVVALCAPAYAQEDVSKFPSKPITYIVPVTPGTGTDLSVRLIAKEAEKFLKQPIVVVNKPGGALTLGTAAIATAKPDGYTIGFSGGPPLFLTPLLEKVPYDPIKDIRSIMQYGGFNFGVYVKGDSSFKTFKDLIAFARQNPKKATYGTVGVNGMPNIMMEEVAKKEKVQFNHIPFKGTSEGQTALLGGHTAFGAGDFNASLVEAKEIRLVMMLKDEPSAEYPGVPTIKELYNLPYPMGITIITQKAVPDAIVKKLDDAFMKAMKEPAFISGMKELQLPVIYRSGKDLDAYVLQSYNYFSRTLKEMGVIK
ncbi:MAG TPA: tripartite tricarboxylate transporter substrate binding protein [Syntrophorhabdales bacterium]|nr:tripartite tricarboxylate transporter substrate binding protein [Syntrophorhabdales bacterium]